MRPAIEFFSDELFIDEACRFTKTAESGLLSQLLTSVKNYTKSHLDENDKFRSVSDIMVPGIFVALGHPWLALLLKIMESYFGFSPGRVLENAWRSIAQSAKDGTVTPQSVDAAAESAVQSEPAAPATQPGATGNAQFKDSEIRNFHLVAIGMSTGITKYAAAKVVAGSLLAKIVSWIIKGSLAAAGIMVAGDIFNRVTGHKDTPPTASGLPSFFSAPAAVSIQTTFKPSAGYVEEHYNVSSVWMEPTPPSNIGDNIVRWATDIYPDLRGHEDLIRSSSNFAKVVSAIQQYNATNTNAAGYTFMPKMFGSRKAVVDLFISDVANHYQEQHSKQGTIDGK